jgi:hypothetical protein
MTAELNQRTRVRDDGCVWVVEQREHAFSDQWRPTFATPHRDSLIAHLQPLVMRRRLVEFEMSLPLVHPAYRAPHGTLGGIPNMVRQT